MTTAPLIFDSGLRLHRPWRKKRGKDRTDLTAAVGNDNFHNGTPVVEQLA